jgi:putative DNA primase/helicase
VDESAGSGDDWPRFDEPSTAPAPPTLTDVGNGERLALKYGDRIRHVHAADQWRIWDGRRWARDSTNEIMRLAKATARQIYQDAAREPDATRRGLLAKHAHASESHRRLQAMIAQASTEEGIAVESSAFDSDEYLLNLGNGVFNLRNGVLYKHDPALMITKLTAIDHDKDAACPTWLAFLDRVFAEREELVSFVQKMAGYCLTGSTDEQALFFLYGLGANGKTITIETLRALCGDYAKQASFESLLEQRGGGGGGPREDIARLEGARLVTATEAPENRRLNEPLIKSLTGGDMVTARHLYSGSFEYRPQFKLILAANHRPQIKGAEEAIWRRMRLIPYDVTIPEAERDPELLDKLRWELPGILNWAIRGCFKWLDEGLGPPPDVQAATASYRTEMDTLGDFIAECCEEIPEAIETAKALFFRYKQWCDETGEYMLTKNQFGRKLTERGFVPDKGGASNSAIRKGLCLISRSGPDNPGTENGNFALNLSHEESPRKAGRDLPVESNLPVEDDRGEAWEPPEEFVFDMPDPAEMIP